MLTPDEGHLDRRIAQEAGTLARAGWSVDIHPSVDPGLRYEDDLERGVRMLKVVQPPRQPSRLRVPLRRVKTLVTRVAPVLGRGIEVSQYRTRDIARGIRDAAFAELVSGSRYDLVFAHDVPVMPLAEALARTWRAQMISDLHEIFPEQDEFFTTRTAKSYWRRLEGAGLEASSGIICVNDAVARYAQETYAPSASVVVVHNAVPFVADPGSTGPSLRSIYSIPADARILLFAGSLRRHKGLETIVAGFAEADLKGWVLAILGEGPIREDLEAAARARGLAGRVFIGGRARQRDLIAVASGADGALMPYTAFGLNYRIATPNKLFEYIQARLPIATSPLPEVQRIVGPLGTAVAVDFSTPASTAAGLRNFVRDVPGISREALEAAAAAVSWDREEPALLDLVDRISEGSASPG